MADPLLSANDRAILNVVRRSEGLVRSGIAGKTHLTQPSVHRILDSLVQRGLIRVGEARASGPGKPSPEIHLDREHHFSLGISVNTDEATVCLANLAGEVVAVKNLPDPSDRTRILRDTATATDQMLAEVGRTSDDLIGVGLAIAGFFVAKGQLNAPEPLSEWSLVDLDHHLSEVFSCRTWVENNATTGAIGESFWGVGRRASHFAYFSFNYGFGGGAILDGQPYRGSHGNAMEISEVFDDVEMQDRPALSYLLEELRAENVEIASVAELRRHFDPDWPGVEAWIERIMPALSRAVRAVRSVLDPQVIVFGGEIPEVLAERLIERIEERPSDWYRYGAPPPTLELAFTEAPDVGPALGAALIPLTAQIFA